MFKSDLALWSILLICLPPKKVARLILTDLKIVSASLKQKKSSPLIQILTQEMRRIEIEETERSWFTTFFILVFVFANYGEMIMRWNHERSMFFVCCPSFDRRWSVDLFFVVDVVGIFSALRRIKRRIARQSTESVVRCIN